MIWKKKKDAFVTKELITPCRSRYSAPSMLVPKKDGKLRLVIDYRILNEQTIKSFWPIPSIEEIFDTLQGSAYFTTIDKSWGFFSYKWNLKVKTSQNYTAFCSHFGSWKMAKHANGIDGQSEYISKSNGARAHWTHVEHYRTLFRCLHHLLNNTKRAHSKTAISFP